MSDEIFDKIRVLADRLEIPILLWTYELSQEHPRGRYTWDGHTLMLDSYNDLLDSCHELAHYMVAEPWQRALPDFGLGIGPHSFRSLDRQLKEKAERLFLLKDQAFVDNQENVASLLTLFIALHVQVPIDQVMYTANETGWRWHEYVPYHHAPDPKDPTKELWQKDLSKMHLYDAPSMREFFGTLLLLRKLGFLTEHNELIAKLNTHTRSPLQGRDRYERP